MINLKEIWIGEQLKVKSKNKVGKFEGLGPKNFAFVKINGKKELVKVDDLELHTKKEPEPVIVVREEEKQFRPYKFFEITMDLHIDKLRPDLSQAEPSRILEYQIRTADYYISEAIFRRQSTVTIIHGKGKGQLKNEVHNLLKTYEEVNFIHEANQGGATEVIFQYK